MASIGARSRPSDWPLARRWSLQAALTGALLVSMAGLATADLVEPTSAVTLLARVDAATRVVAGKWLKRAGQWQQRVVVKEVLFQRRSEWIVGASVIYGRASTTRRPRTNRRRDLERALVPGRAYLVLWNSSGKPETDYALEWVDLPASHTPIAGPWLSYAVTDPFMYQVDWRAAVPVWSGTIDGKGTCAAIPWWPQHRSERFASPPPSSLRMVVDSRWRHFRWQDLLSVLQSPAAAHSPRPTSYLLPCTSRGHSCRKSPSCRFEGKCGRSKDGSCIATSTRHCRASAGCRFGGACTLADGRCIAVGDSCRNKPICDEFSRCTAKSGVCVSAPEGACTPGEHSFREGNFCYEAEPERCAAGFPLCGPFADCESFPHPCWAPASFDCAATRMCLNSRRCRLQDGRCVLGGTPKCAQMDVCSNDGLCHWNGSQCVARGASHAACKATLACKMLGHCHSVAGVCAATENQDCRGAEICPRHGHCTAVAGTCLAMFDSDCALSETCGACKAIDGRCRWRP